MQTYTVAWINSKLKSWFNIMGGEHPMWNDKFMFMVDNKVHANQLDFYCSHLDLLCAKVYQGQVDWYDEGFAQQLV